MSNVYSGFNVAYLNRPLNCKPRKDCLTLTAIGRLQKVESCRPVCTRIIGLIKRSQALNILKWNLLLNFRSSE